MTLALAFLAGSIWGTAVTAFVLHHYHGHKS